MEDPGRSSRRAATVAAEGWCCDDRLNLSQYTSWAFGQRLRGAGLLASMGTVGDCYDNAMMESFWGTMQLELLDSKPWQTRDDLANAVFEWIECWYNPNRRHSSIGMHSPVTFETLHTRSDHDH
jgi:putative transposase